MGLAGPLRCLCPVRTHGDEELFTLPTQHLSLSVVLIGPVLFHLALVPQKVRVVVRDELDLVQHTLEGRHLQSPPAPSRVL